MNERSKSYEIDTKFTNRFIIERYDRDTIFRIAFAATDSTEASRYHSAVIMGADDAKLMARMILGIGDPASDAQAELHPHAPAPPPPEPGRS